MLLGDFLKRELSNGGPWNCSTLPADWCMALGHTDFAAEWRGVTDAGECEAEPARAGGLLALWDRGIGCGLPEVADLLPGDIAVVSVHGLETGAIWTGERWALKARRGLHFLAHDGATVLKVWRP